VTAVIGSRLLRREDAPILTGSARYVDDLPVTGALHAKIVRSPYAHARIRSIDTARAAALPVRRWFQCRAAGAWPHFRGEYAKP